MGHTNQAATRNSYLISKAMRNFLTASMLTMIITQMNLTVDGIMVSHLISPDALSGIHVFTPFEYALAALFMLLCSGAMTLGAKYLGERNYSKFNHTLATSLTSIIVCGIILAVLTLTVGDRLLGFVCHEDRIRDYFITYGTIMLAFGGFHMLDLFYATTISAFGNPKMVTESVIVAAISNAVLDYVFIAWLGMGIAGAAYATILTFLINIVMHTGYMVKEYHSVFSRMIKLFSFKSLRENIVQGLAGASINIIIMVFLLLLNTIVQARQGADGMFAISVFMNIYSWGLMLVNGIGTSTMSVGSFLKGQNDFAGLRFLVHRSIVLVLGSLAAIVLFVQLFPGLITQLFGADTPELVSYANSCIRTCVWLIPTFFFFAYLSLDYQMLGHLLLSPFVMCIFLVILIPCLILCGNTWGDDLIWRAFPLASIIGLVTVVVTTEFFRLRHRSLSPITLLPKADSADSYDVSIKANIDAFKESLSGLGDFLRNSEIEESLAKKINLCLEEAMLNIVQNSGRNMADHYFDVRISILEEKIQAVIKDDGSPFDPVHVPEEKRGLGMTLIHSLCQTIDYKYMYGQNMTIMSWKHGK